MRTKIWRLSGFLICAGTLFSPAAGFALESAWNHKGSLMKLVHSGTEVTIKYLDPNKSLLDHGVQRGTVLFQGTLAEDKSLKGSAFALKHGCDAVSYEATGRFDPTSLLENFEIEGAAPTWPEKGCELKPTEAAAAKAKMVFTPYGSEEEPGDETGAVASSEQASVQVTAAIPAAFPRDAASHGGAVRDGPATKGTLVDNLNQGDPITIVEDTGQTMNGYNWFKIRYQGGKGYHWGGLICVHGDPLPGVLDVCRN